MLEAAYTVLTRWTYHMTLNDKLLVGRYILRGLVHL